MSELSAFQWTVGAWQTETFPNATKESRIAHLKKEVKELAIYHLPEEAADCLLLLLGHAYVCGYDLLEEAKRKLEINRNRKWGEPDHEGVVEHIE